MTKNMQDVFYVVLNQEKDRIEEMAVSLLKKIEPLADLLNPMAGNHEIGDHFFSFNAPIVVVVLAENQTNDVLATQNTESVAEAHGLGILCSGYFTTAANASHKIKNAMGVPWGRRAVMVSVLDHPDVRFYRSVQREKSNITYRQMIYALAW